MIIPKLGIIIPIMGMDKKNLSNVLFSKARQEVLALLFGHPESIYYTNEIIRLTHSGTGAVQRELAKLSSAGLITVKSTGNQKLYQANKESPLFSELRGIVLKTFGLGDVLRQTLKSFISQIQIAFIYGSIAKQEDSAKSDIDLMVITNELTYADLYKALEKAELQLHRPINPNIYSPTEWSHKRKTSNNFLTQVVKQPKIFLIGTEAELTKLG